MNLHQDEDKNRVQAVREAQRLALELTAGFLAVRTIKSLRALREECGVIHETKDEALVSPTGQVAHKAYERFLTVVERAQYFGIEVDHAIREGVTASDMSDDAWAEVAVALAHYEPQFGIA
jgi:hypothetical protein